MTVEQLARRLNIVGGPPEAVFPKNVGLLSFNPQPDSFFPVTQIDVVYFPDGAGGDHFEEKIFKGPLGRITRDALSYIEAQYLKELDLTEGRSTGLPKIFRKMAHNGSPKPIFKTDKERSYFLVRLPVHEKVVKFEHITAHVTAHVTELVERLLFVLERTELGRQYRATINLTGVATIMLAG